MSDGSGGRVKNPTCDGLIIKALKKKKEMHIAHTVKA